MELSLSTASREPIHRQLAMQIREGIARGRLKPGEKLPSVRELSRRLVVNPNTIARVYGDLERDGVVHTRPGMGVFVARLSSDLTKTARRKRLVELLDAWLTEAVHLGFSRDEAFAAVTERAAAFRWESS